MTTDLQIHIDHIVVSERLRKDLGDLSDLDTIGEVGLIHPIVLRKTEVPSTIVPGTTVLGFQLVAGGRRLTWLRANGADYLHHGTTCDPLRPGFVFADELPDDVAKAIELYENLNRKQMTWQERALAISDIHTLKMKVAAKDREDWGMKETGAELGVDYAHVSHLILVAEELRKEPKSSIWECEHQTAAIKWRVDQRLDAAKRALARMTLAQGNNTTSAPIIAQSQVGLTPQTAEKIQVRLSSFLHLGKMEDVLPTLDRVDHIVTDWPYAIDMDNLQQQNTGMDVSRTASEHDKQTNLDQFGTWLELMFAGLKNTGFCVIWCDIEHWGLMTQLAEDVGFKVCRWPLHWIKTHPCLNQAAQFNFTKAVEHAMVLRKGSAMLQKQQPRNYLVCGNEESKARFNHPFAKPPTLWKWVLEAIALPGSTILDPFAGVGSSTCSAIECGMKPVAVECNELHYTELVLNVTNTYNALTKGKAQFV